MSGVSEAKDMSAAVGCPFPVLSPTPTRQAENSYPLAETWRGVVRK